MDITEIALRALQVLSPVLLAGLTWLVARAAALIRIRIESEYLRGALVRLEDAIVTATKDLQQTIVAEIKAASADGKISAEERRRIKAAAVANVKSYLGPRGVAEISRILGLPGTALDGLIAAKVEAAVHDLRHDMTNGVHRNGISMPLVPGA